jgi:hydroxypyruvate reductase
MEKREGNAMNEKLRADAEYIVRSAVRSVLPDEAVARALAGVTFPGRVILVAVGKAGWQMAKAALACLPGKIGKGIVLTKYGHILHPLEGVECLEAGHPVPDEGSFSGTQRILDMTRDLSQEDTVLFLLSGGGSALFEKPLVPGEVLQDVTGQLLACGADIVEINTIRKRLSAVKGGRFAQHCAPAQVFSIVLSDILGDPLDMIASGPAVPDTATKEQALAIARKYGLKMPDYAWELLEKETPKSLTNVTTQINGSVKELCAAAAVACRELGYEPVMLTDQLCCQAKEAGSFLASVLKTHAGSGKKLAFLAGGETVVQLTGKGKGGRNQELALAAAVGIDAIAGAAVFSVGSDGTDGPTDAAGGYVDYTTAAELKAQGIEIFDVLKQNDAYHALQKVGGLVFTGPTGTNVNDVAVALLG